MQHYENQNNCLCVVDVGITGGKLKVDIGVSVGVGASVAVEIDVSKPVKALCDWADSALGSLGGWSNK